MPNNLDILKDDAIFKTVFKNVTLKIIIYYFYFCID